MATYTQAQVDDAVRKALAPYSYSSYLDIATPYTTPSVTLNVPTKVLIPTIVKSANAWALFDKGGSDFALQFQGSKLTTFEIFLSTSMTTVTNNVVFEMFMYKNGVYEPGIDISRKIGTGADVGALAIHGEFEVSPNDYIEIYIKTSQTTSVTFIKTAIGIMEKN